MDGASDKVPFDIPCAATSARRGKYTNIYTPTCADELWKLLERETLASSHTLCARPYVVVCESIPFLEGGESSCSPA